MTVVYILQQKDGQWKNENAFLAYRGFTNRGYDVRPFSVEEMKEGLLPLTKETIVHGGIQQVAQALRQIGVRPPEFETYPIVLRRFMDRAPSEVRFSSVTNAVQELGFKPCFIKPSRDHKLFTGQVVTKFADLLSITHVPEDTLVWKLPIIKWLSEYRVFVHKGDLVGVSFYKGDPLVFPDPAVIRSIVSSAKALSQVAFSVDVGVAHFPDRPEKIRNPTLLVEANDAHSLGAYGLPSHIYSQMIEDRWKQMVSENAHG